MAVERAGEVGEGTAGRAAQSAAARWRILVATTASALGRTVGTAVGVGALAGAGQLGIGYGLGLLHFPVPSAAVGGTGISGPPLTGGVWASQLTWLAWLAALAVLAGAASASWVARRHSRGLAPGGRAAVALAAGVGGILVIPLAALPARSAALVGRPEAAEPALDAAQAAGLGLVVGVLAAFAALTVRLVAVSLALVAAASWLLALVSVAPSLGPDADLPDVRLGVLDLPALGGARPTVAVLSAPLLALLVCGAIAAAARSRGLPPLLTAVASAAAPGLLALVYLIGSPGTSERASQVPAYAGSLIALASGLLVALLVGAVRVPSTSDASDAPDLPDRPERSDPLEYSDAVGAGPDAEPVTGYLPPVSPAFPVSPAPFPEPASFAEPASSPEPAPFPEPASSPEPAPFPEPASSAEPTEPRRGRLKLPKLGRKSKPTPQPVEGPPEPVSFEQALEPPPTIPDYAIPDIATPDYATPDPADAEPVSSLDSEPPAPSQTEAPKRRKLRAPGRRSRKQQPLPAEPPPEPEVADTAEPTSPAGPAASPPPAPKRRGEVEHVDWISSLADRSEPEPEPEKVRRRLRRDQDLDAPIDVPEPPTWPANDSPDEPDQPSLLRPYTYPDQPTQQG